MARATRREVNRDMSHGLSILHSHSGLEREMKLPKHVVVVDAKFANLFANERIYPFKHNGVEYVRVPVRSFLEQGGVFKNLMS